MISFRTLDKLHERQRDPDERVRQEVVITICDAAAENISGVSDQVILSLQGEGLKERKEAVFLFNEIFCPEYDCEIIWSLLSQSVAKVHISNWFKCIGIKQNCLSASSGNIYVSILFFIIIFIASQ